MPDPRLNFSIGVQPVTGNVSVRPRATTAFIPLREARPDAQRLRGGRRVAGSLDVTVQNRSAGVADRARVGRRVRREPANSRLVTTDLRLTDPLDGCRGTLATGHESNAVKRRTRGSRWGQGRFRTIGRYASAIARGTAWNIIDGCDRTVIHVSEGTVTVRNLRTGRPLTVRAGQTRTIMARR